MWMIARRHDDHLEVELMPSQGFDLERDVDGCRQFDRNATRGGQSRSR